MKNIHKNFTGVKALQAVDFSLREGEIHALMGEHGAGKSTLIKVLTGVYEKDGGEIFLKGKDKAVAIHSPQDAQNLGISTVYQEITLCPNLSVAENMFIGRTKGRMQNWKKMNADADRILQSLDIPAKATQQLANCSIAIQQMVAIARAVDMDCKVLILDEPASGLDPKGREQILGLIREYHEQMKNTVLLVSHSMEDIAKNVSKILVMNESKLFCYDDTVKVFHRSEELVSMGLAVPQITRVINRLKAMGIDIKDDVYTVGYAKKVILEMLEQKKNK